MIRAQYRFTIDPWRCQGIIDVCYGYNSSEKGQWFFPVGVGVARQVVLQMVLKRWQQDFGLAVTGGPEFYDQPGTVQ
jgi:hypothetical protein